MLDPAVEVRTDAKDANLRGIVADYLLVGSDGSRCVVQFNGPDRHIATLDPPSEGGVLEYAESPRSRMQRFLLRSVAPRDAPIVVIDFLAYEVQPAAQPGVIVRDNNFSEI